MSSLDAAKASKPATPQSGSVFGLAASVVEKLHLSDDSPQKQSQYDFSMLLPKVEQQSGMPERSDSVLSEPREVMDMPAVLASQTVHVQQEIRAATPPPIDQLMHRLEASMEALASVSPKKKSLVY